MPRPLFLVGWLTRDPASEMISRLNGPDIAVRRAAARALREQPNADDRVVAALTKTAKDSDVELRCFSVEALGKLGQTDKSMVLRLNSRTRRRGKACPLGSGVSNRQNRSERQQCAPGA